MFNYSNLLQVQRIRFWKLGLLILFILGSTGCALISDSQESLNGRIILWHSWSDNEAALLTRIVRQFEDVNPGLKVIITSLTEDELLERYQNAVTDGLGPDLMIGSSEWIQVLVEGGDIRPLEESEIRSTNFPSVTIDTVKFEDQVYGLPLFLFPDALYYNTKVSNELPETLDELLDQAEKGNNVAFVPRFQASHWGLQAFGEGLYDLDGKFTLDESGFNEWLSWIDEAKNQSGVILNVDEKSLVELFANGAVGYLVGDPGLLPVISSMMDQEDFEVTLLPSGPNGDAGPLMPIETGFFNPASSDKQAENAVALARYLFSSQQSITFMRELDKVPANPTVQVDPRIYTNVVGFSEQAKSAVALPNDLIRQEYYQIGDQAYSNVLSGFMTPEEAVCRFGRQVIDLQGYEEEDVSLPVDCLTNEVQEDS